MTLQRYLSGVGLALAIAAAAACTVDFDDFSFARPAGGGVATCSEPSDCPGGDDDCQVRTCSNGKCGLKNELAGTPCSAGGGQVCNGAGTCVDCLEDGHCEAPLLCSPTGKCVDPSCDDGKPGPNETGLDCGGICPPCDNEQPCLGPGDCKSLFCDRAAGGEGGAGGFGGGGAGGAGGGMDADDPGTCRPCAGHGDCQDAGGHFCSGGACVPTVANGTACGDGVECASGNCVDGVCCDQPCDEVCAACVQTHTGQPDGTCAAVVEDTDPDMECTATDKATCGANGSGCSGTIGSCNVYDSSTECQPASCDANTNEGTEAASCDGMGSCATNAPKACDPYVCGSSACKTSCASEADCIAAAYCDAGKKCQACGFTPMAPNGKYVVNCTNNSCGSAINCAAGYDCEVNCGTQGCRNSTINCPAGYQCNVVCNGTSACENTIVKATDHGATTIDCKASSNACNNAKVECGLNSCTATCAGASKPALQNCGGANGSCNCTPCP